MSPDRLTALADALRRFAEHEQESFAKRAELREAAAILDRIARVLDVDHPLGSPEEVREAAGILRSLSVVEPVGYVYRDDLALLKTEGACSLYQLEQTFVFMLRQEATPLYLHPAVPLLDPLQAPAEGAVDLLREVLGSLEHEHGASKVDRWFPEARAFIAQSNVSRKEPVEQRNKLDEKSTREGVERDREALHAAFDEYWRESGTMLLAHVKTYTAEEVLGVAEDAARHAYVSAVLDAQMDEQETSGKTGEAPK